MLDVDAVNRQVKGFLKPIFRTDPVTRNRLAGLSENDFRKVAEGYACANADCLAEYYHYTPICPVCGYVRDISKDVVDTPAEWAQHLRDRAEHYTAPVARNPFSIDEFIESVRSDPDIEQRNL